MKRFFPYPACWGCLLAMLLTACIDPISFDTESAEDRFLVVNGTLTNDLGKRELSLFYMNGFETGNSIRQDGVVDAEVRLLEDGELAASFDNLGDGTYVMPGSPENTLEAGKTYLVEIQFSDGTLYRSLPTTLAQAFVADSLSVGYESREVEQNNGFITKKNFVDLFVHNSFPSNGTEPFLRWEIEDDYSFLEYQNENNPFDPTLICYFNRPTSVSPSPILAAEDFEDGPVQKLLLSRQLGRPFQDIHYFSVYQHTISAEAYEYYSKVGLLLESTGNLFDQIPASVPGNVFNLSNSEETVLGFVEFALVDTVRTFVLKRELPNRLIDICEIADEPGPECYDCTQLTGSSLAKPDFWEF